jgi:hypothetical protein
MLLKRPFSFEFGLITMSGTNKLEIASEFLVVSSKVKFCLLKEGALFQA